MFYQRSSSEEWKGPGTVLGQDGAVVFVRYGGTYVRVHRCRLRKVDHSNGMSQETIHEDERDCVVPEYKSYDANQDTDEEDKASVNSTVLADTVNNPNNQQPSLLESDAEERNLEASGQLTSSLASQPTDASRKLTSKLGLKPGQNIQFYMPDSEEHSLHQATIVSRAGKSTGKYCNWYTIQFALPESKSGQATALDLGNVLELTVVKGSNSSSEMHNVSQLDENSRTSSVSTVSPDDEVQEVMLTERICFDKAKSKELASWKEHDVFEEVISLDKNVFLQDGYVP